MKRLLLIGLLWLIPSMSSAETTERVLLPVFTAPADGAFGSRWRSTLVLFNSGSAPLRVEGVSGVCPLLQCPPDPAGEIELQPGETAIGGGHRPGHVPGHFLRITGEEPEALRATLRSTDTSRATENAGTEIPLIDERQFGSTMHLLNVERRPNFRYTLRIYSADPTVVRLRIYRLTNRTILVETFVELRRDDASDELLPAYAEYAEPLPPDPPGAPSGSYHFEVESLDGTPIWAFASLTNNETQLITTVTPQP